MCLPASSLYDLQQERKKNKQKWQNKSFAESALIEMLHDSVLLLIHNHADDPIIMQMIQWQACISQHLPSSLPLVSKVAHPPHPYLSLSLLSVFERDMVYK